MKIKSWIGMLTMVKYPNHHQPKNEGIILTPHYLVCVTWHIQLLNGFIHGV